MGVRHSGAGSGSDIAPLTPWRDRHGTEAALTVPGQGPSHLAQCRGSASPLPSDHPVGCRLHGHHRLSLGSPLGRCVLPPLLELPCDGHVREAAGSIEGLRPPGPTPRIPSPPACSPLPCSRVAATGSASFSRGSPRMIVHSAPIACLHEGTGDPMGVEVDGSTDVWADGRGRGLCSSRLPRCS